MGASFALLDPDQDSDWIRNRNTAQMLILNLWKGPLLTWYFLTSSSLRLLSLQWRSMWPRFASASVCRVTSWVFSPEEELADGSVRTLPWIQPMGNLLIFSLSQRFLWMDHWETFYPFSLLYKCSSRSFEIYVNRLTRKKKAKTTVFLALSTV